MKKNKAALQAFNIITDFLILLLSYKIATYVWLTYFGVSQQNISDNILFGILYASIHLMYFQLLNAYRFAALARVQVQVLKLLQSAVLSFFSFAFLLYLFRLQEFSRGVLGVHFLLSGFCMLCKKVALAHRIAFYKKHGYHQEKVLLVGCGNLAQRYLQHVTQNPGYGYCVCGYLGDDATALPATYLGDYPKLAEVLQDVTIAEVVMALDLSALGQMKHMISACEQQGVKVHIIPFCNDYFPSYPSVQLVEDLKIINMRNIPLDEVHNAFLKRMCDIVASALLLLLVSPLMIAIAVGIKVTSPGPVIFKQVRVGRGKKSFTMYKFRSMRITGTEQTGWSTNQDPRKTKFGSFLRKTSLDEFPQFFNVLKGDMSLIGPRPEVPFHVDHFKDEIPLYMVKHQVKPGITGWAQVNGYRGDTSIEGRVQHDIWYIENWSIWLDLKILCKTVFGGMINGERL